MKPNIVVMLSDDHAQWAAGCYGNSELHTPSMDWLAATGTRMQNAMTVTPVCSPARATFWTGLYPSQHGIHDYIGTGEYRDGPWIESETTLAEILANAGYRCGLFGKWHCGTPEVSRAGFEEWFCIGRRTGPHSGLQEYVHNGSRYSEAGYQAAVTTDAALRFIDGAPLAPGTVDSRGSHRVDGAPLAPGTVGSVGSTRLDGAPLAPGTVGSGSPSRIDGAPRPFFAFIGPVATHTPFADHPERLVESYRGSRFPDIPAEPVHPFGRFAGEGKKAGSANVREWQAQYYAAVTEIDEQLGRVIDFLDQRGELENTIIVYTADHGLNVGHHGLFGKGNATRPLNMLEESVRIPMIVGGWNGLFGRQVRSEFVDHADLFRTLVDAADAELPADRAYPGRSFLPMLTDAAAIPDWKDAQLGEYGDLRMARTRRHKLIRRHGRGADQLFDLIADPRETTNMIDVPEYAGIVRGLDDALERGFAHTADSPKSGLRVAELREHNPVEAWRGEQR